MMKKFLVLLMINFVVFLQAQQSLSVKDVDVLTYEQWLHKDWKALIKTGKDAKSQGIDFLMLDYRMGIAYYELKKYMRAIPYFETVYENKRYDKDVQTYLYYAYLLADRVNDANFIRNNMPLDLLKKLKLDNKPLIEALVINSKFDASIKNEYQAKLGEKVFQIAPGAQSWYNLGITHSLAKKWLFFHSFSYLTTFNKIQTFGTSLPEKYVENIKQYEYYIFTDYQLRTSWDISLAIHYINVGIDAPNPNYDANVNGSKFELYRNNNQSFIGYVGINKYVSLFHLKAGFSASNLNGKMQLQPELHIKIYPFARNLLYFDTGFSGVFEKESANSLALTESMGWRPRPNIFINAFVSVGKMRNYNEYDAFIVYNDLDVSLRRYGINVSYGVMHNHLLLSLMYKYNRKKNQLLRNNEIFSLSYAKNFVNIGLTWKIN